MAWSWCWGSMMTCSWNQKEKVHQCSEGGHRHLQQLSSWLVRMAKTVSIGHEVCFEPWMTWLYLSSQGISFKFIGKVNSRLSTGQDCLPDSGYIIFCDASVTSCLSIPITIICNNHIFHLVHWQSHGHYTWWPWHCSKPERTQSQWFSKQFSFIENFRQRELTTSACNTQHQCFQVANFLILNSITKSIWPPVLYRTSIDRWARKYLTISRVVVDVGN